MGEIEAMKQEILDALDYKTPAGSYRLLVDSMQKVSLCRVYGIRYGEGHLKATIPNGTDEQTIKAHEIVANVIKYGVRKHPEHVNGRTCRELYEENRQLKADLVNWERELNAADAKLKALEDERNLASKQIAGFRFENARLVAINENLENQLKAAEAERDRLESEANFYQTRCDALQDIQSKMRDPERQMVCDILANGKDRETAGVGEYLAKARGK